MELRFIQKCKVHVCWDDNLEDYRREHINHRMVLQFLDEKTRIWKDVPTCPGLITE